MAVIGPIQNIVSVALSDIKVIAFDQRVRQLGTTRSELLRRLIDAHLLSNGDGFTHGYRDGYAAGLQAFVNVVYPQIQAVLQSAIENTVRATVQSVRESTLSVLPPPINEIMAQVPR